MLLTNLVVPALAISASTATAAHLPFTGSKRGSHHGLEKMKRGVLSSNNNNGTTVGHHGAGASKRSAGGKYKKGKRLVRRKAASCSAPNSTVSSSSSMSASPTTSLGEVASSSAASSTTPSPSASPSPSSTSSWKLVETWQGSNFFDNFNFWSWDDPTHGDVQYVDAGTAWDEGLISINDQGQAIMQVETTNNLNRPRKSVRVHGNLVFTGGLVLMDARHMPYGCGTWPAWWQNGPNWPYGGEIDIVEGVNAFTQNQVSLHTGSGCSMPWDIDNGMSGTLIQGSSYNAWDCASYDTSNQGCGVRDEVDPNTYGQQFNLIGGGVYAMSWAKDGINVWFFPRSSIPSDITNDVPDPTTWGTPMANFPSSQCSPYEFFYDNYNIFDTTLCGDWAGADGVWNYAGYAGQDQSCAAITGYSNCVDYVRAQGDAFQDAFWQINYVKYFNSTELV